MATLVPFPGHLEPLLDGEGQLRLRKIFVRDLCLPTQIGVYEKEFGRTQMVLINIELDAVDRDVSTIDELDTVVCYQNIVDDVKSVLGQGHIKLVETLAEKIAKLALSHIDVYAAKVRVEKLEAVAEAKAVGVEITRLRSDYYAQNDRG